MAKLRTLINRWRARQRRQAWVTFYYVGSSPKLHAGYLDRERFADYRIVTFCGQDVGSFLDPRVPGYPPHSSEGQDHMLCASPACRAALARWRTDQQLSPLQPLQLIRGAQ